MWENRVSLEEHLHICIIALVYQGGHKELATIAKYLELPPRRQNSGQEHLMQY